MSIEEIIKKLQAIAKKNDDEFRYKVNIEPSRHGLTFEFVCEEQADGHTFTSGSGVTLEQAIDDADKSIAAACEEWGYEE